MERGPYRRGGIGVKLLGGYYALRGECYTPAGNVEWLSGECAAVQARCGSHRGRRELNRRKLFAKLLRLY
jgi:hypothetical protein